MKENGPQAPDSKWAQEAVMESLGKSSEAWK